MMIINTNYFFSVSEISNATNTNYFQHFYKLMLWLTSYWFSYRLTVNITYLSANNHSPYQKFVIFLFFVKSFVSLTLLN